VVEGVRKVPGFEWITQLVVRLPHTKLQVSKEVNCTADNNLLVAQSMDGANGGQEFMQSDEPFSIHFSLLLVSVTNAGSNETGVH
jgi:hypothetical protein